MAQSGMAARMETAVLESEFEKRTYRKVTIRLVSFLFICWMFNYLDRVNVSFAQMQLRDDLGLSAAAYGLGVSLFFLGVLFLEVPATILLKRIGARLSLTRIMGLMGLICMSMAFMKNEWHWYLLRFLLGAAEGGLWSGIMFYFTLWYPAARRARITSRFLLAIAAAGVLGGPLSGFILEHFMDVAGFRNWQWLFLIEGFLTVCAGIAAFFYLTDRPEDAKWLTEEERAFILDTVRNEEKKKPADAPTNLLAVLRDPRIYVLAAGWTTVPLCGTIVNYWTPAIIKESGISDMVHIGILSALPYILGSISMLFIARSSDLRMERRWHYLFCTTAGAIGAGAVTMVSGNWMIAILCISLVSIAFFAAGSVIWTIPPTYLTGDAAAGGMGVISSFGLTAGFLAPIMIGKLETMTGSFAPGLLVIAGIVFMNGVIVFTGVPRQPRAA